MKTPFTQEQKEKLIQNENVSKIQNKSITYTPAFKVSAVDLYLNKGMAPREIFAQAGFDIGMIGKDSPGWRMHDWLKKFKTEGIEELTIDKRGTTVTAKKGRPKALKNLSNEEKIARLELEVQYLKEENDFLANLRANQAE